MTTTTSPTPTANARPWDDDHRRWQPEPPPAISLPQELFDRYVSEAMKPATPKSNEGRWYCALDEFPGVWAEGDSLKECLDVLEEVLRDWIVVKVVNGDMDLPVVDLTAMKS